MATSDPRDDRVRLVSALWDLKHATRVQDESGLRYIHFNTLLNDPGYRQQILARAARAESAEIRRIAETALALDVDESLKPGDEGGQARAERQAPAGPAPRERLTPSTTSNRFVPGLALITGLTVVALLVVGFTAGNRFLQHRAGQVETVEGSLFGDVRWEADTTYHLTDMVFVESGATLNIEPGTKILGEPGSALVVTRDARLNARGTRDHPIVFTSARPTGERAAGDWGGVVLLGNAPVNTGTSHIEGIAEDDPRGGFGGSDVHSNCGMLQYARIEFAGHEISANNELNGLTLGGCGDATVLRYIQVHRGQDDGIEFFGGTADLRNALVTRPGDDGLDWDRGWTGRAQFIAVAQGVDEGDNGIEADNYKRDHQATPRSAPTLANVTLLGSGNPHGDERAMTLRRGTAGDLRNLLVADFPAETVDIRDTATVEQINAGNLGFAGTILAAGPTSTLFAEEAGEGDDDGGFDEAAYFADNPNVITDARLALEPAGDAIGAPRLIPRLDSPAATAATGVPQGEFWDEGARFVGAVRPGNRTTWLDGWTAYP